MRSSCIQFVSIMGLATLAAAGENTFWVGPESALSVEFDTTTYTGGVLIGNYDEETNPEGTKTMPGVWGSEGNEPIPLSLNQALSGGGTTSPTGSFTLNVDTELGLIGIEDLDIDVLGGETRDDIPVDATIYMYYDTFRTYAPESLFVGGFEVPIPIGTGAVTDWRVEQSGVAGGVLIETGTPGEWTFSAVASVQIFIEVTLEGQPIEIPGAPLELPLSGTYEETTKKQVVTINFDQAIDESEVLSPPIELPDAPLDLPTILPPGSTAHVILSLALTQIDTLLAQAGAIIASRDVEQEVPGDATGDGFVNVDDLLVLISQWGSCPGCAADFTGDGVVGIDDLLIVLANWGT